MIKVVINDSVRKMKLIPMADLISTMADSLEVKASRVCVADVNGRRLATQGDLELVVADAVMMARCPKVVVKAVRDCGVDGVGVAEGQGEASGPKMEGGWHGVIKEEMFTNLQEDVDMPGMPRENIDQEKQAGNKKNKKYAEDINKKQEKKSTNYGKKVMTKVFKTFIEDFPIMVQDDQLAADFIRACKGDLLRVLNKHALSIGLKPSLQSKIKPEHEAGEDKKQSEKNANDTQKKLNKLKERINQVEIVEPSEAKTAVTLKHQIKENSKFIENPKDDKNKQYCSILKKEIKYSPSKIERTVSFSSENEVRYYSPSQDDYEIPDQEVSGSKTICKRMVSDACKEVAVSGNRSCKDKKCRKQKDQPQMNKTDSCDRFSVVTENSSSDDWAIL